MGKGRRGISAFYPHSGWKQSLNHFARNNRMVCFLFVCFSSSDFLFVSEKEGGRRAEGRYGDGNWKIIEKDWVSTVHPVWTIDSAMNFYKLKHCRCIRCMHLHKQKRSLARFFFPFSYQHQKCEFCPQSEAWTPVSMSILQCNSEKILFLSLAPLPNALQPCPIKIYSSHMFLVVTLCSAAVGRLRTPKLSPRHSQPRSRCAWEDQPAEPHQAVNLALKAQPF